jgi:hypothetical protein
MLGTWMVFKKNPHVEKRISDSNCTHTGAVTIIPTKAITMRTRTLYILISLLACTYTSAQSFCDLVQPVGTYYEDTIESAGTYYYSAMTFDPVGRVFHSHGFHLQRAAEVMGRPHLYTGSI